MAGSRKTSEHSEPVAGHGKLIACVLVTVCIASGVAYGQVVNLPPGGPTPPKWSSLPDWNGMWERDGDLVWDDRIAPGQSQAPPYNPAYAKLARSQPTMGPVGPGMPAMMTMVFPLEIEINPREVLLIGESNTVRRIYTDGRRHPVEPLPSTTGHSVGRWEGKALVVDTCCVKANVRLPGGGPHSDKLHVSERFSTPDPNTLRDEITVEDPEALTKPWTTVKTFRRRPDWEPVEFDRTENDRDTPAGRTRGQAYPAPLEAPQPLPADIKIATGAEAERLQKATAMAVGALAWEGVKVFNIEHAAAGLRWEAATRSSRLRCTAKPDGSDSECER